VIDTEQVRRLIAGGESLTVEFKSEQREPLSEKDIAEAVVCLANADGGVLLLGVENDGHVTGAQSRYTTEVGLQRLTAGIASRTVPRIQAAASVHEIDGSLVVAIEVDLGQFRDVFATSDGKCVRRVMGVQGPQCVPFLPFQHAGRRADLRLLDFTAQMVEWARWDDLDPIEIERLRQTIDRLNGDRVLLGLDDRALVQALQLVETRGDELIPTIAGLLLIGRESSLRRAVPGHEIAFQVIDTRAAVSVNAWFHGPILESIDAIQQLFQVVYHEEEATVGLFRLPIPNYAPDAFREAVNNAILHRDYAQLGTVFVQFHPDHLLLTNPGGFLEGITLDNLLVHEPKPRNPRLAEAFRRIGLVETTGRGIDRIFDGQARYGRPLPDYSRSDRETVRLEIRGGDASLAFSVFVYEQDRAGNRLHLDDLLVMNYLQHERRVDAQTVGKLTQRGESHARAVLERLVERGLVEPRRDGRERVYHLSANVYKQIGMPDAYVRMRGFDSIRQESMVLEYIAAHGRITRREVRQLCGIEDLEAKNLLRRMVREKKLHLVGSRNRAYYVSA
jgi:ATP-dependent DNA helicase RecG